MKPVTLGKAGAQRPRTVGVIASAEDLAAARRLRRLPDLFELRLDALCSDLAAIEAVIGSLGVPLIITARHPAEGGANELTAADRRALLLQFLPHAHFVDVELRAVAALDVVLREAAQRRVTRIISVHNFRRTPSGAQLAQLAERASAAPADILKLATRVDSSADLTRLVAAFEILKAQLPAVSAMGVGALGRESRRELIARGSVLNYAHLGTAQVDGQFSLPELRRLMRRR